MLYLLLYLDLVFVFAIVFRVFVFAYAQVSDIKGENTDPCPICVKTLGSEVSIAEFPW